MYKENMNNNRAQLYGESIFTSFRYYGTHVPGFDLHLERLRFALSKYFLLRDISQDDFKQFLGLDASKIQQNHYFRVTIFADDGDISLKKLRFGLSDLKVEITRKPMNNLNPTLKVTKNNFTLNYINPKIKIGSLGQNIFLKRAAILNGYDDTLLVSFSRITELSTANIVFEKNNKLFFPKGDNIFRGITSELLKSFCQKEQISFVEKEIFTKDLNSFDRAYSLNCVQGVSCIKQIDQLELEGVKSLTLKKFTSFLRGSDE